MHCSTLLELAYSLACTGASLGEVPVGAVITHNNQIVSTGFNLRERNQLTCDHAEMIALTEANQRLNSWRLPQCQIYVTLEPCLMCASALIEARISDVFFLLSDPKKGGFGGLYHLHEDIRLNHQPAIHQLEIPLRLDYEQLLKQFFQQRRL